MKPIYELIERFLRDCPPQHAIPVLSTVLADYCRKEQVEELKPEYIEHTVFVLTKSIEFITEAHHAVTKGGAVWNN